MSKVEVLCATMHQNDFSKIKEMNIASDVVFANQASDTKYEELSFDSYTAKMITTSTRGVGKNRNITLTYSSGEYLLFSDDDLKYVDGYAEIIETAFSQIPEADCIIFNIETIGADFNRRKNEKIKRVRWYNALNYGTARIAVKRTAIAREGIMFNTNFGGGTPFSCGEDTLYIVEMLRKKLKMYTYPAVIAAVDQTDSTWFRGYNKKFYYDQGVLFATVSRRFARLLCLQSIIRHRNYKQGGLTFGEAYKQMKRGISAQKHLIPFKE